jgi:hypothetical protein
MKIYSKISTFGRKLLSVKVLSGFIGVFLLSFLLNSCDKKSTSEPTSYTIRMTDYPGPYEEVNIDLQSIEVIGNGGVVVLLNTNPGIYNLLELSNGLDTIIANGSTNLTSVKQIRLILGPNNTIKVNGMVYPLSTPSAEQSGLKVQVHHKLQPGLPYNVLIDFDANQSIVEQGNGQYLLKPVLRIIDTTINGSIHGKVLPLGTLAIVTANAGALSYSSAVNKKGDFIIKGLPAGLYTVIVTPTLPLLADTVSNVKVNLGQSTDIGIIQY